MELLRVATAGSVDDGKSTLIGRLLYDSKQVFEDHYEAIERASLQRGDNEVDLSLLTDGLRAEREQGITIDVAYRYFATPKRKFVIADTPGHFQHTRNMMTGCSTADLVVILVDARNGITEQTCRHASIASLLGIKHLVICVNKMDLVGYDQRRFEEIADEFAAFASGLDVADVTYIPLSALRGDNVVERSVEMPWYEGTALLHHLEQVQVGSSRDLVNARFPVQLVMRPLAGDSNGLRGYAGTVAGGVLRGGDVLIALAESAAFPHRCDRDRRWARRGGVPDDVRRRAPCRPARYRPRRLALRARERASCGQRSVGDDLLDGRRAAHPGSPPPAQAHHALGDRPGRGRDGPSRRSYPRAGPQRERPRPQRSWSHRTPSLGAAVLRRLPAQPREPGASSWSTPPRRQPWPQGCSLARSHSRPVRSSRIVFRGLRGARPRVRGADPSCFVDVPGLWGETEPLGVTTSIGPSYFASIALGDRARCLDLGSTHGMFAFV